MSKPQLKIINLILILFFISFHATADTGNTRDLSQIDIHEASRLVAQKISSLDKEDLNLLKKIRRTWKTKCNKNPNGCFISESEIFDGGLKDRVLLFRGEPGLYPTPGTSPLLRVAIKSKEFCEGACAGSIVIKNALRKIQELLTYNVLEESRMTVSDVAYLMAEHKWKSVIHAGAEVKFSDLGDPVRSLEGAQTSAKVIVNQQHIDGTFLPIIDELGNTAKFDPYVSLTANPLVAHEFATKGQVGGTSSRLIVVSYPRKDLQLISKFNCTSWPREVAQLVNISLCSSAEEYPDEYEYDAALQLDPESIRASLLLKGGVSGRSSP